jgi:hypothetical protein
MRQKNTSWYTAGSRLNVLKRSYRSLILNVRGPGYWQQQMVMMVPPGFGTLANWMTGEASDVKLREILADLESVGDDAVEDLVQNLQQAL